MKMDDFFLEEFMGLPKIEENSRVLIDLADIYFSNTMQFIFGA
jgi:hypothetical protein